MSSLLTSASEEDASAAPPLAFACSRALWYSSALRVSASTAFSIGAKFKWSGTASTEADMERSHAVVLQECGVVRTGTERRNAPIGTFANFFAQFRRFGVGNFVKLLALPHAEFRFRV